MMDESRCMIGIGDICLSIGSDDQNFINHFRHYYRHSVTDKSPDFSVNVNIQENIRPNEIPGSLDDYRRCQNFLQEGNFSLYDNLLSGSLDEVGKTCEISVETAVVASEYLPLFQDLLFKDLYYYIRRIKQDNGRCRTFFVHGCGILHKGYGFLFTGPSGAGKSTVAALSNGDTILHDEALLISQTDGQYLIESTPYLSDNLKISNAKARLRAGFFLKHSKANKIVNPPKPKLAQMFLQQIVPPCGFQKQPSGEILKQMLSFSCEIVENIPFFDLYFLKDDNSFWKTIDDKIGKSKY